MTQKLFVFEVNKAKDTKTEKSAKFREEISPKIYDHGFLKIFSIVALSPESEEEKYS